MGAAVTILVEKVKSEHVFAAVEVLVSHPAWAISLALVQFFFKSQRCAFLFVKEFRFQPNGAGVKSSNSSVHTDLIDVTTVWDRHQNLHLSRVGWCHSCLVGTNQSQFSHT